MNNISTGITLGLVALFSNGMAGFLSKIPSNRIGVNRLILYRNIANTVLLSFTLLFTLNQAVFSPRYMLYALVLSILGYIPMYYFYKAITVGKVGVVSPVASANALITTLLAIMFYGERLAFLQLLAIFAIVAGIVLISLNFNELKKSNIFSINSGVPYALIAAFGWGIWSFLIKIPASHLGPYLTSLIIEGGAIFVALYLMLRSKESVFCKDRKAMSYILPISVFMVLWSLSFYQGIRIANVSIIITLSSASPLIVVLLGRIFYREKLAINHYLAIVMIVAGIILISV